MLRLCGQLYAETAKMAQALLNDLLVAALETQAEYMVSSNVGCALHIAEGLKERGIKMKVVHPVVLIARQLKLKNT